MSASKHYDGATLRTAEEARDRAQKLRIAELRKRFVDGPVLTCLPVAAAQATLGTASAFLGLVPCSFTISPFPLDGVVSTPTEVSCALQMDPHSLCR